MRGGHAVLLVLRVQLCHSRAGGRLWKSQHGQASRDDGAHSLGNKICLFIQLGNSHLVTHIGEDSRCIGAVSSRPFRLAGVDTCWSRGSEAREGDTINARICTGNELSIDMSHKLIHSRPHDRPAAQHEHPLSLENAGSHGLVRADLHAPSGPLSIQRWTKTETVSKMGAGWESERIAHF